VCPGYAHVYGALGAGALPRAHSVAGLCGGKWLKDFVAMDTPIKIALLSFSRISLASSKV